MIEPYDIRGGEDYYADEKWDFHRIVQIEKQLFDAMARGNVDIGEFRLIEDDEPGETQESEPDPE